MIKTWFAKRAGNQSGLGSEDTPIPVLEPRPEDTPQETGDKIPAVRLLVGHGFGHFRNSVASTCLLHPQSRAAKPAGRLDALAAQCRGGQIFN